jgi:hypothetical protein
MPSALDMPLIAILTAPRVRVISPNLSLPAIPPMAIVAAELIVGLLTPVSR